MSTDTETHKQDEERPNKQAIEVPLWVLILAALGLGAALVWWVSKEAEKERKKSS